MKRTMKFPVNGPTLLSRRPTLFALTTTTTTTTVLVTATVTSPSPATRDIANRDNILRRIRLRVRITRDYYARLHLVHPTNLPAAISPRRMLLLKAWR